MAGNWPGGSAGTPGRRGERVGHHRVSIERKRGVKIRRETRVTPASGSAKTTGCDAGNPAIQIRFSRFRRTVQQDPVKRQETQIMQSWLTLRDFLPGFRPLPFRRGGRPGGPARTPGRTFRIRADTRRSAHKSSVVIHYRWHPLCGRELDVCGRHVRGGESSFVVVLPDGTRSEIPEWMTRADAGNGARLVSSPPTVSVAALRALRRLLDAHMDGGEPSSGRNNSASPVSGGS